MSATTEGTPPAHRRIAKPGLFLRRWLANPKQMGSIAPSSPTLCRNMVAHARWEADEYVLELGPGTGVISRALLAAGLPPEKLILVEIEPAMAAHLRESLPGVRVITGDACDLARLLPAEMHGKIGTVLCGVPLVLLPRAVQRRFIDAIEAVAPGRGFVLFTYCFTSPLPWRELRLRARRLSWTPRNIPPASVWRYLPEAA